MNAPGKRLSVVAPAAIAGILLFWFLGNPTHGYIHSNSLFYWWIFQWINPLSETEHGWLILALSAFAFWRNLRRDSGESAPETGTGLVGIAIGLIVHCAGFVAQQ